MTVFYWVLFLAIVLLLAYASIFSIMPFVFMLGGALLGLGYLSFLVVRKRKSGVWEHRRYQPRFVGSIFLFFVIYWTIVAVFSNVKEQREFWARYEPYLTDGQQHGYTFYYLDYANAYERIDSPTLNRHLENSKPEKVKIVLEIVKDFGRLRAYSVRSVEAIAVNKTWTSGEPPWPALREP